MQVEILVINESNLNYQLLRQVALTFPPELQPVSQLNNPLSSESDFQFWTVFAVTTQILY